MEDNPPKMRVKRRSTRRSLIRETILGRGSERETDQSEDYYLQQLFSNRPDRTSLSDIESFINIGSIIGPGGIGIGVGTGVSATTTAANAESSHRHNHGPTLSQSMADDVRSTHSFRSNFSVHSTMTRNSKRKLKDLPGGAPKPQIYAGITHSDLDIQQFRPPLMYQMNIIEWWWLQCFVFHRVMIIILALLVSLATINIVFGILLFLQGDTTNVNPYECRSFACKNLGKRLLKRLNKSVNPCDDFYAFVCGSSEVNKNLSEEEDEDWNFGHYLGRAYYDFYTSVTLGKMFRNTKQFPSDQILPFYKSCLDEVQRDKMGLEPFYDVLKDFGLYNVSKNNAHRSSDVIQGIASILSHSLKTAAILSDKYIMDSDGNIHMSLQPSVLGPFRAGGVYMYGYSLFKDTVKNSFQMLTELNVDSADLDVISHDIVCLELLLRDRAKTYWSAEKQNQDILKIMEGDPDIAGKTCPGSTAEASSVPGNFGKPADGEFNYSEFARKIYQHVNPDWDSTGTVPIILEPHSDQWSNQRFLIDFENVFKQSAPHRLLRYLQWRLFYTLSYDLNKAALAATRPVKRHYFTGVPQCVQSIFQWMQFAAPERFLHSVGNSLVIDIYKEFEALLDMVRTTYYKIIVRGQFTEYEKHLKKTFSDREKELLREVVAGMMRNGDVSPVIFEDRNFPGYVELYKDIKLTMDDGIIANMMKLGLRMMKWRLSEEFKEIFYGIDPEIQAGVSMDKVISVYNHVQHKYVLYLPFAGVEVPYFRDGLMISDFGGISYMYTGAVERASMIFAPGAGRGEELLYYLTNNDHNNLLTRGFTREEIVQMIANAKAVFESIMKDYSKKHREAAWSNTYVMANTQFRYEIGSMHSTRELVLDQRRIHLLSIMIDDFLSKPENWKEKKAILDGLNEYDSKQLFYISLVNRRCGDLGMKKFNHIKSYGPVTQVIRTNVAFSNLEHFATTFNCPSGSPMNSENKTYYWDRNVNISHFQFNESVIAFTH